jgi:hypothetical protein
MEAAMKIFFLIVVMFMDGKILDYNVGFGGDEAKCQSVKAEIAEAAKAKGADVWAECFEVKHQPKKAAAPKPESGSDS